MNAKNDGFIAQSPPAWDSYMPGSPHSAPHSNSPLSLNPASGLGITTEEENLSASPQLAATPASSISILPSSMPAYHAALMGRQPHREQPALSTSASSLSATPKKPRQTKWQFGIRSRNAPLEAVSCIYRALKKLGAEWVSPPPAAPESSSSSSDGEEEDANTTTNGSSNPPKDPWIIQARWKKFAPKDPELEPEMGRREDHVYVHLTIQLYQLEHDNYLVDFKCAGYERLPKEEGGSAGGGGRGKKVGFEEALGGDAKGEKTGRRGEEYKEVNSPFPFLDAAGALIIALADAGD
jgi:carbon catabolite-derepressing protein kinase